MFSYTTGSGKLFIDSDTIIIKKRPLFKKFITTKKAHEITKIEYMLPDKNAKKDGFIRFFYDGCPPPEKSYPYGRSNNFIYDILLVSIYYGAYELENRLTEALRKLSRIVKCEIVQLKRPVDAKQRKLKDTSGRNTAIKAETAPKIDSIQIKNALQEQADNYIRIIQESANILDKTTNPDTFFSRYTLMLENIKLLIEFQKNINIDSASNQQVYYKTVNNKQTYIRSFITRYWNSTAEKIMQLKTEKAKNNNRQKFIDSLQKYENEMSDENKAYYISICKI